MDAQHFERTVVRSRELLALGEPERAAYLLEQALSLWRGRAFEDVEAWDRAIIEAGRLEELRLEAEELRVDACLRSGRHQEVLAAAESMVKAHRCGNDAGTCSSWAQYQAGRQTEALRTIQRVKLAARGPAGPGPWARTGERWRRRSCGRTSAHVRGPSSGRARRVRTKG